MPFHDFSSSALAGLPLLAPNNGFELSSEAVAAILRGGDEVASPEGDLARFSACPARIGEWLGLDFFLS